MPNLIPAEGPLNAKIAIIGEAPGKDEDRYGRPFVGASGLLLNDMLRLVGIARSDCYLTNVVKEHPAKNDITPFIDLSKKEPKKSEAYIRYEEQLYEELKTLDANVLVAAGNISLYALTRMKGILKRRGSILSTSDGRKVIPILHPAAAIRNFIWRYWIINDLSRVLEESTTPALNLTKRDMRLRPSYSEAMAFLLECKKAPRVGVDIEVNMSTLEMSCIGFALDPCLAMCIPFLDEQGDYFTPPQEIEVMKLVASIIEDPSIEKVNQNIKFDLGFMFNRFGIRFKNYEDTMIAQALITPDFPKGLDFITSLHTREPYYKDEGKMHMKYGQGGLESFWLYNAKDCCVVLEAFPKQYQELIALNNTGVYETVRNLIEPLIFVEEHGIRVNIEGLKQASILADKELELKAKEFNSLCSTETWINHRSNKQLQDYFYGTLRIDAYINKKTKRPTLDKLALDRLATGTSKREGLKEARVLTDLRKLEKLNGTYYKMKMSNDGRLRCSFNPVGTVSGRFSSKKDIFGRGGNMQNIPGDVKIHLKADEGYIAFDIDLSQAENRVVAYIAPEPSMIAAFEAKVDIHKKTAAGIYSIAIHEVSKAIGSANIPNSDMSQRDVGKRSNHSLNYDIGVEKFSLMNYIPLATAKFFKQRYSEIYPGIPNYHAWIKAAVQKDRILTTPFGRTRKFMDQMDEDLYRAAYSWIPQSLVGDMMNQWGFRFVYEEKKLFVNAHIMNVVHDSIVIQFKLGDWNEIARGLLALKESLQQTIDWRGTRFSIPADCKMGLNLKSRNPLNPQHGTMVSIDWTKNDSVETLAEHLNEVFLQNGFDHEEEILINTLDISDVSLEPEEEEIEILFQGE